MTESDGTTQINLYPSAEVALPDRGMRVEISSDFPRLTNTRIRVECQKAQTHSLALRIPPWARALKVECNGLDLEQPQPFTGRGTLAQCPETSVPRHRMLAWFHSQ